MIIFIDSSIITLLLTKPKDSEEARQCQDWLYYAIGRGATLYIPEICDYEIRRGILYTQEKTKVNQFYKLNELEVLRNNIIFLSLTEYTARKAAIIWAKARAMGRTQPKGVSADIIILGHVKLMQEEYPGRQITIATKNINDFTFLPKDFLDIYVADWKDIKL